MASFKTRVTGNAARKLDQLREILGGRRPDRVTTAIRDALLRRAGASFDTKTAPNGKRWRDWAKSTAAGKALVPGASPYKPGPVSLLEETGAMRASLFAKTVRGRVEIGFNAPYASFHETGTRNMPARRVLTDDGKTLARSHRISAGIAAKKAIDKTLLELFR